MQERLRGEADSKRQWGFLFFKDAALIPKLCNFKGSCAESRNFLGEKKTNCQAPPLESNKSLFHAATVRVLCNITLHVPLLYGLV